MTEEYDEEYTRADNLDPDAALQAEDYWRQRAEAAERDNARLREALRPFGLIADVIEQIEQDNGTWELADALLTRMELDEKAKEARAALSETADPSPWRPIATAPTDGTEVLLFVSHCGDARSRQVVAYYDRDDGIWREAEDGAMVPRVFGPMRWMPLPNPPEDQSDE